jgi:hypothetical protein
MYFIILFINFIFGGDIIKRKLFNVIMFILSIIYLVGTIGLLLFKKINFDLLNLFNTDGLALLGCFFAVGELILSKRNYISKKINEVLISRKYTNFRIDISTRSLKKVINIEEVANQLETVFNANLNISNLGRKPQNKLIDNRWVLRYENLGIDVEYLQQNNNLYITLKGKSQYGKINIKDKYILYLSILVKMLSNEFLQDKNIRKLIEVTKIDLIIKRDGSQFEYGNIFNEDLVEVQDYNIKIIKDLTQKSEVFINKSEIKLSVLTEGAFFESFIEFTNIICSIN